MAHIENILPWWLSGKESACLCRRHRSDPGSGRSRGEGNGNPLLYQKKKKRKYPFVVSLVQFSSDDQLCLTLWDPMDCSTSGFPGLHYLPEFAQTHVHWVGDAIQPSCPPSPPSPPTFNLSQHPGLSQWVDFTSGGLSSRISASASLLPMNIQSWFPLELTVWSLYCPRDSQESKQ